MKNILVFGLIFITNFLIAQTQYDSDIKFSSEYGTNNSELRDILQFEGIEYLKLRFSGKKLADKSYHLTVKEIWNGEIKTDTTIMNSALMPFEQLQKINDTIFQIKVISKLTNENKVKMTFKFPRFSTTREFNAIESDDYSLRVVAEENGIDMNYGEQFYLLAYILPYEKDGSKYWCAVESSGIDVENWGRKFGIKHYLLFEMIFK